MLGGVQTGRVGPAWEGGLAQRGWVWLGGGVHSRGRVSLDGSSQKKVGLAQRWVKAWRGKGGSFDMLSFLACSSFLAVCLDSYASCVIFRLCV